MHRVADPPRAGHQCVSVSDTSTPPCTPLSPSLTASSASSSSTPSVTARTTAADSPAYKSVIPIRSAPPSDSSAVGRRRRSLQYGPHVTRAIDIIQRVHQGERPASWCRLKLAKAEYKHLRDALGQLGLYGWFEDKLRHDYDPIAGELILRMPAPLHNKFALDLSDLLMAKLAALRDDETGAVKRLVNAISEGGSGDVPMLPGGIRSPDACFCAKGVKYPSLIIEMANSQKSEALPSLAGKWIKSTNGGVKTVITVDTEYRTPKQRQRKDAPPRQTAFSVYRYLKEDRRTESGKIVGRANANQRDIVLEAGNESPLSLSLFDFCHRDMYSKSKDPNPRILISHNELLALLQDAKKRQEVVDSEALVSHKRARESRSPTADRFSEDSSPRPTKYVRKKG